MRRGATFIEVLEEKLGAFADGDPPPSAARGFRTAPILGFFYFDPGLRAPAVPSRAAVSAHAASLSQVSSGQSSIQPGLPPRPQPRLTPRQQLALDALTGLGGSIGADFTAEELRRTFRSLARQYHPDRHPLSSEGEKARLAILFAQVRDAYTHLHVALATAA